MNQTIVKCDQLHSAMPVQMPLPTVDLICLHGFFFSVYKVKGASICIAPIGFDIYTLKEKKDLNGNHHRLYALRPLTMISLSIPH
jgi:hypothetical protein